MISSSIIILCLASFAAGFVDSIVGGGGLVQLPALMMVLPQYPVVALLGTNKLVSITGSSFSAWRYSRHVPFIGSILIPAVISAFLSSFLGAYIVTIISNDFLKPLFMLLMFGVFIFSIKNKSFGLAQKNFDSNVPLWKPIAIGTCLGFYDGFFGPGTGSFLIIGFVGLMGMTFVQGSAYAKVVNITTNLAAILLFMIKGTFLLEYAVPMIAFNIFGAFLGVRLAILRGNEFVRVLLRAIIFLTIVKLAYQIGNEYLF